MEVQARYVLIGAVALAALVLASALGLWIADAKFRQESTGYDVYFDDPISGIQRGSEVRFNGIRVGQVDEIHIDPQKPGRVRVTLAVEPHVPIQVGATATVMPLGITGASFIQIEGGREAAPPLTAENGQPRPVIPSEPSPLQELIGGVPDLVNQALILVDRLAAIADEPNRRSLARSIANLERVTSALDDELDRMLSVMEATARDTRNAATAIERLATRGETWLSDDLPPLTTRAQASVRAFERLAVRLDSNLNARLAPRLYGALAELESAAQAARRVAERLEESPREYIFGAEHVPEGRIP